MQVKYSEVKKGDKLLVRRDSEDAKKPKREAVVADVSSQMTKSGDLVVMVTLKDGDVHYGWSQNTIEKVDKSS